MPPPPARASCRFSTFSHSFLIPYTFWAGLIGGTFFTTASHGTDQLIVQRLLAARRQKQSVTALLIERSGSSVSVRAVSDRRSHAVGLLPRALGELWQARPDLSHIHRHAHAARNLRLADRCDPGGRNVESQRSAKFSLVERDHGFLCASLRPQADEQNKDAAFADRNSGLGARAVSAWRSLLCTKSGAWSKWVCRSPPWPTEPARRVSAWACLRAGQTKPER